MSALSLREQVTAHLKAEALAKVMADREARWRGIFKDNPDCTVEYIMQIARCGSPLTARKYAAKCGYVFAESPSSMPREMPESHKQAIADVLDGHLGDAGRTRHHSANDRGMTAAQPTPFSWQIIRRAIIAKWFDRRPYARICREEGRLKSGESDAERVFCEDMTDDFNAKCEDYLELEG